MKIDSKARREMATHDECESSFVDPARIVADAVPSATTAPAGRGAYFLLLGDLITYVGHAKNIRRRLASHRSEQRKYGDKQWDRYYAIADVSETAARALEALYARWLQPTYNMKSMDGLVPSWAEWKLDELGGPAPLPAAPTRFSPEFVQDQLRKLEQM